MDKRDVCGAIGVVLDGRDRGRDTVLAALEVDAAVLALGASTTVARRNASMRVAPAGFGESLRKRLLGLLLRDLRPIRIGGKTPARTGGLVLLDCHQSISVGNRRGRLGATLPRKQGATRATHASDR